MRELSFLNKGITINLTDRRKKVDDDFKKESFHSDEGLKEFIKFLDENREPLIPEVISIEGQKNDVPVEIAMIYNSSFGFQERFDINPKKICRFFGSSR